MGHILMMWMWKAALLLFIGYILVGQYCNVKVALKLPTTYCNRSF